MNKHQCVNLYGVDPSILQSIDMEYYYEGDHLKDPLGTGQNY